jgi:hypothetical protein
MTPASALARGAVNAINPQSSRLGASKMRLEDLSLSAFVAGTAIGYLIWFWLRGGGTKTDLHKHQFLLVAFIVCGVLLAILLVAETWGIDTLYYAHKFVSIIGLIVAVAIAASLLWQYWPRKKNRGKKFVIGLEVTLAILFTFVLSFLVIVLLWGPQSLYLRSLNQWFVSAPLGALISGMIFGGVSGEWLQYILLPAKMRSESLTLAHQRWGYVLIALMVLGILYPVFPQLLRNIGSANVSTPVGSLSFTIQNVQSISGVTQAQSGPHTSETAGTARPPWPSLPVLQLIAKRDKDYIKYFFANSGDESPALDTLFDGSDGFLEQVLSPLGGCIRAHFDTYHSPQMTLLYLAPVLGVYRAAVYAKGSPQKVQDLRDQLAQAAHKFGVDLPGHQDCSNAEAQAKKWNKPVSTTLPYFAMGFAYLLYDSDAIDQAARELAQWKDNHFGKSASEQIQQCNDKKLTSDCANLGYFSKDAWHQLPFWFKIRAEFDLAAILGSNSRAALTTFRISKTTVEDLKSAIRNSSIGPIEKWSEKSCPALDPTVGKPQQDLQRRAILAYVTMVDQMLKYLIRVVDESLNDKDATITPEMLDYAEANTAINFNCFPAPSPGDVKQWQSLLVSWKAQFRATYGSILTQLITKREPPYGLSDIERAGRNQAIINARANLLRAIDILQRSVDEQKTENSNGPLADQLFFYTDDEQYLREAQAKLDQLNALLH